MNDTDYKKNYLEYFIEMLIAERGAAHNTVISYKKDINDLYSYLDKNSIKLRDVTGHNIVDFIAELSKRNLGAKTIGRKISAYRQFFLFLISDGFMEENPALTLVMPRKPQSLPKALSTTTLNKLLKTSELDKSKEGTRTYAMLEILYSTGMRITELVSLEIKMLKNVFDKEDTNFLIIKGKGMKERAVILSKVANLALRKYLEKRNLFLKDGAKSNWLFPSYTKSSGAIHITRQRFGQILKELAKTAMIDPSTLSPHKIRHSFATHMLENGANLRIVQELLGHSDISSTQIYTKISDTSRKKLLLDAHPLSNKEIDEEKK